jgi:outer membrane protein assembly factor BamB
MRQPERQEHAMRRWALIIACFGLTLGTARSADWPVFGGASSRAGVARDSLLTPLTVPRLRMRWRVMLGAISDAAPIVVGDRVVITTGDGVTSAIDAVNGTVRWRFVTHGPKITSSVPAYDAVGGVLYVPGVDGSVHALDPADGHELHQHGFPIAITRAPQTEKDASALNIAAGFLYAQTSGYVGDATPYVGHVVAIDLHAGTTHVFNALCSARRGLIDPASCAAQRAGMWSRSGVVVDPEPTMDGRIYAATGNAPFDGAAGDFGDSILSLTKDADRLIGTLTPADADRLDEHDLDVGSSAPALLPRQVDSATPLLAVQGGKDSILRVFDRTRLGDPRATIQTLALGHELFSAPAVWTRADGPTFVFVQLSDGMHAYRVVTVDGKTRLDVAWQTPLEAGNQGTSPVVSDGVIFVALSGELVALDAQTGRRLWGHPLGPIHWQSPALAGDAVYCADGTGALYAFALPSGGS